MDRASMVLHQHEEALLAYAHVVGVAVANRMKGGVPTNEVAIVIYVDRKLAESELLPDEILPKEIDGVPVDVVETGPIVAQQPSD